MVIGWADSFIGNEAAFHQALKRAGSLAPEVDGVILAVPATYPATGYGYIEIGEPVPGYEGAFSIARFEEKPNLDRATEFFTSDDHFWNPGISVWKASRLLELIKDFEPAQHTALQKVATVIGSANEITQTEEAFMGLEPIAIDHAIFERATRMAAIPADLEWSDVGSWNSLYELQANGDSNVIHGQVVTVETEKCLIYSQKRLIATLGVSDLVIVETDDAVLIVHKSATERLKELYAKVKVLGGLEYL